MRILILSLGPIFPDCVHGGSQKILKDVAFSMSEKGCDVTILCNGRADNNTSFLMGRVTVKPILRFKETFPAAYFTSISNLSQTRRIIQEYQDLADVVYMHDAGMLFFDLIKKPLIVSPRDMLYPETLIGMLNYGGDGIIVSTEYVRDLIKELRPDLELETHITIIPNGVNRDQFRKTDPSALKKRLGLPEGRYLILPHREPSKGFSESLLVFSKLKNKKNVFLLVPKWMDMNLSPEVAMRYESFLQEAESLGVVENVILHDWVSQEDMPAYYSLADITLCIGLFPESFGNVSVESVACGTPVIVSRVAAQRYIFPEQAIPKIDPGDIESAAKYVESILTNGWDLSFAEEFLGKYDYQKMLDSYENTLINAQKNAPRKKKITSNNTIPAWCYTTSKGIYNDFTQQYAYPEIVSWLNGGKTPPKQILRRAKQEGYLQ